MKEIYNHAGDTGNEHKEGILQAYPIFLLIHFHDNAGSPGSDEKQQQPCSNKQCILQTLNTSHTDFFGGGGMRTEIFLAQLTSALEQLPKQVPENRTNIKNKSLNIQNNLNHK